MYSIFGAKKHVYRPITFYTFLKMDAILFYFVYSGDRQAFKNLWQEYDLKTCNYFVANTYEFKLALQNMLAIFFLITFPLITAFQKSYHMF